MNTYFDNASTSWPKPQAVYAAVAECMEHLMGNPSRSSGGGATQFIYETRHRLAKLFNIPDESRILFTLNATHATNLAIQGFVRPGDHVVTSSMEHNAVCRPLEALKKYRDITYEIVQASPEGYLDPDDVRKALTRKTRLLVINHASNVFGSVNHLEPIGKVAAEAGVPLMVDASQSAGVVPIDVIRDNIAILAAPGHKSLLGPTGTGFCYFSEEIDVKPLLFGGTGSLSELACLPDILPDRYEAGTLNFHGIAGLNAGVAYILETGHEKILDIERKIIEQTLEGLTGIPGIVLHGPKHVENRLPVFSVTCPGQDPSDLANILAEDFNISTRVGLHCAPWAHQTVGTYPEGTVRISPGIFHTPEEIDFMVDAVKKSVKKLLS